MNYSLMAIAASLLYVLTSGLLGLRLARSSATQSWNKNGLLALGLGAVLLHGIVLGHDVLRPEGMNLAFFSALSFTAWLVALVALIAAFPKPVENLGIVLLPFAALALVLAVAFPDERIVNDGGLWQLQLHILLSIAAYALLAVAAVQAVLLWFQDNHLRRRKPSGVLRGLPPLMAMEGLLFEMIGVGFALLSLALLSGILFLDDIFAQHLVHKTVLSLVAWAVFGMLLLGRWKRGWRGRTAIRWTLSGFAVLVVAYFGSKLVLELILQR